MRFSGVFLFVLFWLNLTYQIVFTGDNSGTTPLFSSLWDNFGDNHGNNF